MNGGSRAFSAPGKALFVGGYLVLKPYYSSLVVALSARMHAVIRASDEKATEAVNVKVTSPQFNDEQWCYTLSKARGFFPFEHGDRSNPFIEQTLFNVFNYFYNIEEYPKDIEINIYSDAEYHSQEDCTIKRNKFKQFNFHKKYIEEVPKTGLGSSAGLVTVLTASVCSLFAKNFDTSNEEHLHMVHGLAQVSHCQAQGKIGSGFDVAAATYGSLIYRRFKPELIAGLPTMDFKNVKLYHEALRKLVDVTDWDILMERVRIPKGLKLVMGDVNNGSETVKLVAKVKKWYDDNEPRSTAIFEEINQNNNKVMDGTFELNRMSDENPEDYEKMLTALRNGSISEFTELATIADAIKNIRRNFQLISRESGADIEPEVQTHLLDECSKLKGVLTCVTPGAGGFDAIVLIADENTDIVAETKDKQAFKNVTWLDLREGDVGILSEDPKYYENLE